MGKKDREQRPGYGKLLDAWTAPEPDDSGEPIGCVATSFTFSPAFFEEECLARFLQLESDPAEDGPAYLVEREEKLAQLACAAALVDQHHCRGSRNLRWDLIPARMPRGSVQHAKVSLLYWSKLVRVVVASANLTEDGYRRNQEVFGVLDFTPSGEVPVSCLRETTQFLRKAALFSKTPDSPGSPAVSRWNRLLDRVDRESRTWGPPDGERGNEGLRARPLFSGPGYSNLFDSLRGFWPGGSPPDSATILSPFFDRPESPNRPAEELWRLVRQRGGATAEYYVTAEDVPGDGRVFLFAPRSLLNAQPTRATARTDFYRVLVPANRPLHAKGIWLQDERWSVYMVGSSNFTSAGTGLRTPPNLEANLVYVLDSARAGKSGNLLEAAFPEGEHVPLDGNVTWKPQSGGGEDEAGDEVLLPESFGDAVYDRDEKDGATVTLSIVGSPPPGWRLDAEDDGRHVFGEQEWWAQGRPGTCVLPWDADRPPSGFWVRWADGAQNAWWPVNALAGDSLPPPAELKDLPLEVLINVLSSARPLHRVLADYLRRRGRAKPTEKDQPVVDPHKRVDTSQFLLQRTRRVSWALNALRERLERPAATAEYLRWRLRGPVGVLSLAKALHREARSDEERAFLVAELALELVRVKPPAEKGCLPPKQHLEEVRGVIPELKALIPPATPGGPENLRRYVESVFERVGV